MTTSLLVFVPVALLALIAAFGFVGCVFNTHGLGGSTFTNYSGTDVKGNAFCVAYWPLFDASLPVPSPPDPLTKIVAADVIGNANGAYKSVASDPGLFPCPAFTVAANTDTAFAPGTLTVAAPGIVKGDAVQPANDPAVLTGAMQCDGGFVEVPHSSVINPAAPFTIEAWARPEWVAGSNAFRVLIDSRNNNAMGNDGYAIWVNEDGNWEAVINCTNGKNVLVTGSPASLSAATHVVLTLGTDDNASLFIDGERVSPVTPLPAGEQFSANKAIATVFGVGMRFLDSRVNGTGDQFFPLFPFKGTIQDIAIYTEVLPDQTIKVHADNGNGIITE